MPPDNASGVVVPTKRRVFAYDNEKRNIPGAPLVVREEGVAGDARGSSFGGVQCATRARDRHLPALPNPRGGRPSSARRENPLGGAEAGLGKTRAVVRFLPGARLAVDRVLQPWRVEGDLGSCGPGAPKTG